MSALRPTILATLAFLSLACPAAAETATKEKVEAAIPKLEQMAKDAIAKGEVPGLAIAIVYKDEVIYLGGFGVRELASPARSMPTLCSTSAPSPSRSPRRSWRRW